MNVARERIKTLRNAADAIQWDTPVIANGLRCMAVEIENELTVTRFSVGDKVQTSVGILGAQYDGEIRSVFTDKAGKLCYIVELDGTSGLLIRDDPQLRKA